MSEKKELKIEDVDKNLKLPTKLDKDDIVFYDVRQKPFEIYGLYSPETKGSFLRMPEEVPEKVNENLSLLNKSTAGGRVRFSTDSKYVAIKVTMPRPRVMNHMPVTGSVGFDVYCDTDAGSYFCGILAPSFNIRGQSFETSIDFENGGRFETILTLHGEGVKNYTINFPTYSGFDELYIGLQESAYVGSGAKYGYDKPILYYGSSITQGGCSSRPGTCYEAIISRKLNVDHVNLGFSGNGKGEDPIIDHIASLDPLIFVCDYDYNAPTPEYLEPTHLKLYETFRAAHPDTPYVMVSKPDWGKPFWDIGGISRRAVIHKNFMKGIEKGDKNLYFIDGESIFSGFGELADCTVDGCHPTDLGFYFMAERIGATIKNILMKM